MIGGDIKVYICNDVAFDLINESVKAIEEEQHVNSVTLGDLKDFIKGESNVD